jgi:hypothetical protein
VILAFLGIVQTGPRAEFFQKAVIRRMKALLAGIVIRAHGFTLMVPMGIQSASIKQVGVKLTKIGSRTKWYNAGSERAKRYGTIYSRPDMVDDFHVLSYRHLLLR